MSNPKRPMCPNWLAYWRICRKLNMYEMAQLWGCSPGHMYNLLREYGHESRTSRYPVNSYRVTFCRDWLIYWRICRKASIETIASLKGCSAPTVAKALKMYKIPSIKKYNKVKTRIPVKRVRFKNPKNPFSRDDCGVSMETAILEPERQQAMRNFLGSLTEAYDMAIKHGRKKPSISNYMKTYRRSGRALLK